MRLRAYIAGPIGRGDLTLNIFAATEAGMRLVAEGWAPYVPQLTCYLGGPEPHANPCGVGWGTWLECCLPWVRVSHALLRLPGESKGAELEVAEARRLGIPVFYDIEEMVRWGRSAAGGAGGGGTAGPTPAVSGSLAAVAAS